MTGPVALMDIVTGNPATVTGNALKVGGQIVTLAPTVTGSTSPAYTSGDNVGGLLTLTSALLSAGGSGLIQSVVLNSNSAQTTGYDVVFFNANPSGSTFTDNAAQAIVDADVPKIIGVAHLNDIIQYAAESTAQAQNLAIPVKAASGTTLYAAIVVRGTPTLTGTGDLSLNIQILQN